MKKLTVIVEKVFKHEFKKMFGHVLDGVRTSSRNQKYEISIFIVSSIFYLDKDSIWSFSSFILLKGRFLLNDSNFFSDLIPMEDTEPPGET